jgi:hypothetical protein
MSKGRPSPVWATLADALRTPMIVS